MPTDADVTDVLDLSPELPEFPVIEIPGDSGFPCSSS